jgi:catechol 2,3-dioxygenase-like lactoylglutathione lyase family enzyme/heme-degrading monooxygenase HmoA
MASQVVRVWKGYGTQAGVDRYCHEHFPNSVLPHLRLIDGFVEARVMTRAGRDETELVVATVWDSISSVKAFAGENYEEAVVEPVVSELLARFDDRVAHFEVARTAPASKELRLVLTVDDFAYVTAFFREALGLKQVAAWENDGGHAVLLDAGRATLEIFDEAQARAIDQIEVGRRVAGQMRVAFRTSDSELAAHALAAAGAEILAGPVVTPWGDRNVRLQGPEGVQLTLFTPLEE